MSAAVRNVIVGLMTSDDIIDSIAGAAVRRLLGDQTFRDSIKEALSYQVAAYHSSLEATAVLNDLDVADQDDDEIPSAQPSPA